MTAVFVSITDVNVGKTLQAMRAQLSSMEPVYKAIGTKLESNINLRFDTKTDPAGKAWAPWSEYTKKKREKQKRGTLLEFTGRMRDSLTFIADNEGVEVGFGLEYAKYHEGLTKGKGIIPKRAMLFDNGQLSATDATDVIAAAMGAIQKKLNLVGGS